MDSSARAEVAALYRGLLERDNRAGADLVAHTARLLASDMQLSPASPSGGVTDYSAMDFTESSAASLAGASAYELANTAARQEERDYAIFCKQMGVEGYV